MSSTRHAKKMEQRRKLKRMRREAYAALAGTSQRSKRQRKSTEPSGRKHEHLMANCGNVGCSRCFRR